MQGYTVSLLTNKMCELRDTEIEGGSMTLTKIRQSYER